MTTKQVGNNYNSRTIFVSLIILLFCCLISYWPLSTGLFSLKNDIVVYFLPVRFQISEMFHQGQFPFWTPYINLGHPLYTDMQSGVWNPIVWFFSLFGSYTMRTIQLELLLYIYLSGVSMFFLLRHFKINCTANLIIAISFMLCGFISDTTQTLYWISGMAFLPLVFLYFLKVLEEKTFSATLLFGFCTYLLFATAYPGEFIIIAYLLLSYLIVFITQNKKEAFSILKKMFLAVIIFSLFALPSIISYVSGLSYISRGGGVDLELALTNSMHPYSIISYIFPLAAWKLPLNETDITARNSFIGLLPFLLLLITLFTKTKNTLLVFLKWTFVLTLILSLGKYGYLRSLTYYILPYTDTFRHPSMFRFITIFSGCILGAFTLDKLVKDNEALSALRKKSFIAVAGLLVITTFLILFFSSASFNQLMPSSFTIDSLKNWLDNSTIKNWLIIELMIQIPFLLLIYLYFVKKINTRIILFIAILNSAIHTIILQPITVAGTETVSSFQNKINSFKREGFPLPDLDKKINADTTQNKIEFSKYGPSYVYSKNIDYKFDFITPGPLITHENFMKKSVIQRAIFDYPILYRADTAMLYSDTLALPFDKRFVVVDSLSLLSEIINYKPDTSFSKKMLSFSPDKWEFEITASEEGFYCLLQNYYPNWQLSVNKKKEPAYLCNGGLIGFKLQPGKNIVTLEFKDNKIRYLFYTNLVLLILFLIFLSRKILLYFFRNKQKDEL